MPAITVVFAVKDCFRSLGLWTQNVLITSTSRQAGEIEARPQPGCHLYSRHFGMLDGANQTFARQDSLRVRRKLLV